MIMIVEIQSFCIRRRRIVVNRGIISISLILFLLLHSFPSAGAQPPSIPPPAGQFPYQFNPSVAAIIIVLIAALFFMGFFSVYIRQCYDVNPNGTGNSFRRGTGGIGASLRRRAARGLDQTVIENLPTFPYSEVKELKIGKGALECAVCLNEFDDDEILRLLPKCDHVFHPECIDAWLKSHVTCPVCRSNLAAAVQNETIVENPETIPAPAVVTGENPVNEEVTIQIQDESSEENDRNQHPEVVDRTRSLNQIRPPLPPASKSIRGWPFWSKFPRSHSTGHSVVQPGENTDRFTLRLPEEVRKEVMTKALNRTRSLLLPSEGNTRRGYRSEGSSRGIRVETNNGRFSGRVKSDRWVFTKAPPFFSRASSVKSPRVAADGEGSTSSRTPRSGGGAMSVKLPSFKCLEPNAKDEETGLVSADSIKSPVREVELH